MTLPPCRFPLWSATEADQEQTDRLASVVAEFLGNKPKITQASLLVGLFNSIAYALDATTAGELQDISMELQRQYFLRRLALYCEEFTQAVNKWVDERASIICRRQEIRRICTTCSLQGSVDVPDALYVATASNKLQWFECGKHGEWEHAEACNERNDARAVRCALVALDVWFRQIGVYDGKD